jgi:hypothetical protein
VGDHTEKNSRAKKRKQKKKKKKKRKKKLFSNNPCLPAYEPE